MSKRFRFFLVVIILALSILAIYPTFEWYFLYDENQREILSSSRLVLRDSARADARIVLDELKDIVADDESAPLPDKYSFLANSAEENYALDEREPPKPWTVKLVLESFLTEQEAFSSIERYYFDNLEKQKGKKNRIIQLGLDLFGGVRLLLRPDEESIEEQYGRSPTETELDEALDVAMEVLTSRIDAFGVSEPQIRKQRDQQISLEIPGDNDPERIQALLSGKGSLFLVLVDEEATDQLIALQRVNPGWDYLIDGTPEFVQNDSRVAEYVTKDEFGLEQRVRWIVIYRNPEENGILGEYITDARTAQDPITGRPLVSFTLDAEGADIFAKFTRDNVGKSLAIVMDDRVRAYAQIQSEIPNGQGSIQGFTQQESSDIALVLRTAALPVKLNVESQETVGASIGATAIQAGIQAVSIAFILVILFMLVYYKGAGTIAGSVLIFNLLMLIATLSVFNLTLTLTSIAAIVLTVGMSVDANVIVFERIKEEYLAGKSIRASIDAGFKKAFWTIMDANITTFIAAFFLSQVTTGPVQGFAVTLSVGIVTSMISALFYARLVFDIGCEAIGWKKLSIAWKKRVVQS